MKAPRLAGEQAQLLVIDLQQKLLPHIADQELVIAQTIRMLRAARELALPITLTEQYPEGLGRTPRAVLAAAEGATRLEKTAFSAWREEPVRRHLLSLSRPQVLLCGIETHVCVQQTALDLAAAGLTPLVLADAVGSRRPLDREVSLGRMRAAEVTVTTVESAIFELLERAGTDVFKRILPIVR